MKLQWVFAVVVVAGVLIKKNLCVPAIRPLSQRGIIFPVENWDDCFTDEGSSHPGLCKSLEECPEVLKKWDTENIYPKTCYFIKKEQFVCCPITTIKDTFTGFSSERPVNIFLQPLTTKRPSNIFLDKIKNTTTTTTFPTSTTTKRPSNIFLDKIKNSTTTTTFPTSTTTKRPSNIFLDKIKNSTTTTIFPTSTTTKRPSNIFLDNLSTSTDRTTATPTTTFNLPDIFTTDKPSFVKRRSETECDLQNTNAINGSSSQQINEFPYMTLLGWKSNADDTIWYPCGGILVSPNFVLTAAHCAEIAGETPSFVHLGDKMLADAEKDFIKIKQFIVHPNYNASTTIYNDIALVELEQEVNIPVACLWTQHDLPLTQLTALGYSQTRFDNILSTNRLLKTSLNAIDNTDCQEYYKFDEKLKTVKVVDSHLCAGDVKNVHRSCQADTGGPLVMALDNANYVVGINSFAVGCADLPPSIYTRVSSFIDWLEPIIWPEIDVRFDKK